MILHLVAKKAWESKPVDQPYLPDTFSKDGFMHCTQGDALMLQVANRFYKDVPGDFLALDIDEHKVTAQIKWEAASHPASSAPNAQSAPVVPDAPASHDAPSVQPPADAIQTEAMPPEAKAEFGSTPPASAASTATVPAPVTVAVVAPVAAPTDPLFPHIYGPLNLDAIVSIRRAVRASDGTFIRFVLLDPSTPQGMNLKKPSELARELVDATGEFSDALARYKDKIEAHIDELDKNIKGKLG